MWLSKLFIIFGLCVMLSSEAESAETAEPAGSAESAEDEEISHLHVNQIGTIQARLNFTIPRKSPNNIVVFLNQDRRWTHIFNDYIKLIKQQKIIHKLWMDLEKYTNISVKIDQDVNCLKADKIENKDVMWTIIILDDGSWKVPKEFYRYPKRDSDPEMDMPDCANISSLPFSMFSFEHLEGIRELDTKLYPCHELNMKKMVSDIGRFNQFGYWLTGQMLQNSSSWVHYHLASLLHRLMAKGIEASECSRRAVLYAPREYKDIALGGLGMTLFRRDKLNDSIVVLQAALDHDPTNYACNFVLANAYALISKFNTAVKYYDRTIKLKPEFALARKHRYAALCNTKFTGMFRALRETLNKLRQVVKDYTETEENWLQLITEFFFDSKTKDGPVCRHLVMEYKMIKDATGLDTSGFEKQTIKNSLIQKFIDHHNCADNYLSRAGPNIVWRIKSIEDRLRSLNEPPDGISVGPGIRFVVKEASSVDEALLDTPRTPATEGEKRGTGNKPASKEGDEIQWTEFETGMQQYLPYGQVNNQREDFDVKKNWPTTKFCERASPNYPARYYGVHPIFLPFENKGVRIEPLLSEKIGVPLTRVHETPWYPPTCPISDPVSHFLMYEKYVKPGEQSYDVFEASFLRNKLLQYVGNGVIENAANMHEDEIGHRIYVAMKMKLAPNWMMYTLASLYWRVRRNNENALHCLQAAGSRITSNYADIVMVSISSIYLEMGHFNESLLIAQQALKLNPNEPATNFILAELNMMKKDPKALLFHIKQVLRVEPSFMGGLARRLLNVWACILKHNRVVFGNDRHMKIICSRVKPVLTNVICGRYSDDCPIIDLLCYDTYNKALLLNNLSTKTKGDKETAKAEEPNYYIDYETSRKNYVSESHEDKFQDMLRMVDFLMRKGIQNQSVKEFEPDDLKINEEDCKFYKMQLDYWLHVMGFRDLLVEANLKLPLKIKTSTPSYKKVSRCAVMPSAADAYYAGRLSKIETEGWEPVDSVKEILSGMFDNMDFNLLGAKINEYVENKPQSWLGNLAAGWWCGAAGNGPCAVQCLTAARENAPHKYKHLSLHLLTALLLVHKNMDEAIEMAYLALNTSPFSPIEWLMVALAHSYKSEEYDRAVKLYRVSIKVKEDFIPSKACLQATVCAAFYNKLY